MFEKKFENVDVLETLNRILLKNTTHYRKDFEYDKASIQKASVSDKPEDKTLLWISRPCGTYCFSEWNVFQDGTPANTTWTYYGDTESDGILAFAINLKGKKFSHSLSKQIKDTDIASSINASCIFTPILYHGSNGESTAFHRVFKKILLSFLFADIMEAN